VAHAVKLQVVTLIRGAEAYTLPET